MGLIHFNMYWANFPGQPVPHPDDRQPGEHARDLGQCHQEEVHRSHFPAAGRDPLRHPGRERQRADLSAQAEGAGL